MLFWFYFASRPIPTALSPLPERRDRRRLALPLPFLAPRRRRRRARPTGRRRICSCRLGRRGYRRRRGGERWWRGKPEKALKAEEEPAGNVAGGVPALRGLGVGQQRVAAGPQQRERLPAEVEVFVGALLLGWSDWLDKTETTHKKIQIQRTSYWRVGTGGPKRKYCFSPEL
jgi:hypothetical protein